MAGELVERRLAAVVIGWKFAARERLLEILVGADDGE
ncbi:hypothetical protein CASFOL_001287 [Castilleja foliolosa]